MQQIETVSRTTGARLRLRLLPDHYQRTQRHLRPCDAGVAHDSYKYRDVRRAAGVPERFQPGGTLLAQHVRRAGCSGGGAVQLIRAGGTPVKSARVTCATSSTSPSPTSMVPAVFFHIYKRASKGRQRASAGVPCTLGSMLDVKPILYCHQDQTGRWTKVRGFDAGVERLFTKAAERIRRGLEVPHIVIISYGGPLEHVSGFPGYAAFERAANEAGVNIRFVADEQDRRRERWPGCRDAGFRRQWPALH